MTTPKFTPTVVGKNVRILRKRCGISMERLASLSGVSRQTIVGIELGYCDQQNSKQGTIKSLADALAVTVAKLYSEPDKRRTHTHTPKKAYDTKPRSALRKAG